MEKTCEFCKSLSPIVYCKSDAAHLCLSCDAKVHLANALSYRHERTLVCEYCRYRPASVRCFAHEMFLCESCDTSLHFSSKHDKKVVSCYVGCPSAKDLAALWGFDHLNEGDNKNSFLIVQQIRDLEKLQISEGIDNSCLGHFKERTGGLSFKLRKIVDNDNHDEHFGGQLDFQHIGSPREESSSSPFSQMDNLTSSGNPLQGDSFWQCKSPTHNNEIWLQNMQDLGVCDEVQCFDDVNIPDVDLTFRNFEELFGNEHEPNRSLIDDENMACSFEDNHLPFGKLDRGYASTIEQSVLFGKEINFSDDQVHQLQTFNYQDDELELSPTFPEQLYGSYDPENTKLDGKENVIMRYKEKKVLRHEKQAQYTSSKSRADGKW